MKKDVAFEIYLLFQVRTTHQKFYERMAPFCSLLPSAYVTCIDNSSMTLIFFQQEMYYNHMSKRNLELHWLKLFLILQKRYVVKD